VNAESTCSSGLAQLSVNGDNGHGDNCEFYLDVYRTHKALSNHTCRRVLVPTESKELSAADSSCYGYVRRYQKGSDAAGGSLNQERFFESMEKTIDSGKEGAVITLTDHGNKVGMETCEDSSECFSDPSRMESQVSMGEDSVSASTLREKILEINQRQSMLHCQCKDCACPLVPPMIFNFDHCYSGGMLDALFDPKTGQTMNNVCGLSAADEGEMSYTGENIAKSMNELRTGVKGKFASSYKKYDLDGDNAFSLEEIQRYMAKKTKRSTPLLSSQKYLLNYYNKNNLHLVDHSLESEDISTTCPPGTMIFTDEDFYLDGLRAELEIQKSELEKDTSFITGDTYDFNNDQTLALLEVADTRIQKTMDEYLQNENLEIGIMNKLEEIVDQTNFGKMDRAENIIISNKNRIRLNKKLICRDNPLCQQLEQKASELRDKEYSSGGISTKEKEELDDLESRMDVYIQQEMVSCEIKCQRIKESERKLAESEREYKEYSKMYRQNMEEENKLVMDKVVESFSGVENRFVKEESKTKYLTEISRFKSDVSTFIEDGQASYEKIKDLVDEFIKDKVRPLMEANNEEIHQVHLNNVRVRKAINNVKFFQAKRDILNKKDIDTLKNYNALRLCESTPLIKF